MTHEEYEAAMKELEGLMTGDPKKGTPEGDRLNVLAVMIEEYENGSDVMVEVLKYPTSPELREIAEKREAIFRLIIKEPLFQFLKHNPSGRTILCLLANGQISLGKAAEAITEKFCLGLDPALPEWKGYDAEDNTAPRS